MKIAIVYNEPVAGNPDSEDVLEGAALVEEALRSLGYDSKLFPVGDNRGLFSLSESVFFLLMSLRKYSPDIIFNLVEGFMDDPLFQHHFSMVFEISGYPFTGSRHEAILTTTDKGISKMIMKAFQVKTAPYQEYRGQKIKVSVPSPWIVKPALQDASIGIEDISIISDETSLAFYLSNTYMKYNRQPLIIEQFIEGREFNVSVLETDKGDIIVLPSAEIVFSDWPEEKPKIVGYKAKWDRTSFEYSNTKRLFLEDQVLHDILRGIALRCWKIFNLSGYARVDMRMDNSGNVYVIEVNANPCIAPDSGFIAAAHKGGYNEETVIKEIIGSALIGSKYRKKSPSEGRQNSGTERLT